MVLDVAVNEHGIEVIPVTSIGIDASLSWTHDFLSLNTWMDCVATYSKKKKKRICLKVSA